MNQFVDIKNRYRKINNRFGIRTGNTIRNNNELNNIYRNINNNVYYYYVPFWYNFNKNKNWTIKRLVKINDKNNTINKIDDTSEEYHDVILRYHNYKLGRSEKRPYYRSVYKSKFIEGYNLYTKKSVVFANFLRSERMYSAYMILKNHPIFINIFNKQSELREKMRKSIRLNNHKIKNKQRIKQSSDFKKNINLFLKNI